MTAINILNGSKHEVHKFKNVLYLILSPETEVPYYILEKATYKEEDIKTGYKYNHFKINDELYTGFYSNVYESFASDQMNIWELI